jgi:hypothetical protein
MNDEPAAMNPPPVPSENWYCLINGQKEGPKTRDAIKELISSKKLTEEDLVWKAGMSDWSPLR